jgi:hypothetical protein
MKIKLSDLAKFQPKCIFARGKVDVERSDVASVIFREFCCDWGILVTSCYTTRNHWPIVFSPTGLLTDIPSVRDISRRLHLWINGHNFLDFKRRSKLHDVTTCPSVCPQAPFSKRRTFVPFCDHHSAVHHPVFESYISIQFIIPS